MQFLGKWGGEITNMPDIQIDSNMIADIVTMKEAVKESVEAVMNGSLTASHLASKVSELLDQIDRLEALWRAASEKPAPAAEAQPEQPAQEAPPAAEAQPEQPAQEAPPAEQPVQEQAAEQEAQAEEQPAQ
jgi:hypothetical protein